MQCILDNTIFEDDIFQENESEDPNEIIPQNNEQNPEENLTKHNYFSQLNLKEIPFLEYKGEKDEFTLFNYKGDIKVDDESSIEIQKNFPFEYPEEPNSKEKEEENNINEDELRFGLGPAHPFPQQPLQMLELKIEMKLFDESLEKEFSSKYEKKPIFKQNRLSTKRRRKLMGDNMRKRIKSDFCKGIKKELNKIIKDNNIAQFFDFPQSIITDVTKERNKNNLGMTLEELLSSGDYNSRIITKKRKKDINSKFPLWNLTRRYIEVKETERIQKNNKELLNILEQNQNEQINVFLKKKMEKLYEEYLNSKRFEESIEGLIKEGNYYDYIYEYIEIAKAFVFFCKNKKIVDEDEED